MASPSAGLAAEVEASSPQQVLSRCREAVRPALASAIDRLPPPTRPMARYACGLGTAGDTPREAGTAPGGGKGVRQAFAILAGEAACGRGEPAVPAAVAVELLHAFSLVHDDLMDGDEWRRHRPTLWRAFGTAQAILAGDALLALALDVVAGSPDDRCPQAVRLVCAALSGLMHGQAQDLQFEARPWRGRHAVLPEEYRSMAVNKTGALLGCAAALGALLAGGPGPLVDGFSAAGRHAGLAFQAVDDLLGIWGDPAETGKPVGNDLRRRKKTLPVVAALGRDDGTGCRLAALLGGEGELDEDHVRRAMGLIEEAGGREVTLAEGRRALGRAREALADIPLRPRAWQQLTALFDYLVGRTL